MVKRFSAEVPAIVEMEQVFQMGLDELKRTQGSPSWSFAAWEMVRVKEKVTKRRERTFQQVRYMIRRMERECPEFCSLPIGSIKGDDCRMAFVKAFPRPIQTDKARTVFSGVWTLAIKRGWAVSNPTKALDVLKKEEQEIRALTPAEVRALLEACRPALPSDGAKFDLTGMRPAVAILAFAGVRPEELLRLSWDDVSFDEGVITVRGMASKTGGARHVTMCEALRSWLELVPEEVRSGAIVAEHWRRRWDAVRERAGWGKRNPWPKDVLRHTFASYHAKVHQDFGLLQMEMGHRSAELLRNRYTNMRGVTKADAAAFWALFPG